MNLHIEGLTVETSSGLTGEEIVRLYPKGRSKRRFIQMEMGKNGSAVITLIEGKVAPGIDIGERQCLARDANKYANRVIRAMAALYLRVDEARDGYATIDVEMVKRGFHITFAPDGEAGWLREDGSTVVVISQTNEGGLPFVGDFTAQGIIRSVIGGTVTVFSTSIEQLIEYVDSGAYAKHLIPGQELEFWITPATGKNKFN